MKRIIALGHYSRTGKNALATILQRKLGGPERCKQISFAYELKNICHQMFSWAGVREPEFYDTPEGEQLRNVTLPMLGRTPVELWIKLGDQMRDEYHPSVWTNIAKRDMDHHLLSDTKNWCVITDFRFRHEWDMVRAADGVIVRVVRPNVVPRNSRADTDLLGRDDWDFTINNNGSLYDLERAADLLLTELHRADGTNRVIDAKPTESITCFELKEQLACL